jgi:DNA-directed RNA polymerase specialized sigma24 family protein
MREKEPPPVAPRLLAALAQADLPDLVARLLGYANHRLRCHRWNGSNGAPPSGETAEDLVQEALKKALSGERKYGDHIDLYAFFVNVVKSLISHLPAKDENRCVHFSLEEKAETLTDGKTVTREAELAAAAEVAGVLRTFKADERMKEYIHLRIEERCRTADEYARALGVSVADVRNMDRRLARYRARQRREERPTDGPGN